MQHQVLLIEDSLSFQVLVKKALSDQNIQIDAAATAAEARALLKSKLYRLILLDVDLPDANGFDLFVELQSAVSRGQIQNTPVIFLTGMHEVTSKVTAFSLGAEDYIVKPFDVLEFRARVEAKLRKLSASPHTDLISIGELTIRPKLLKAALCADGKEEELELTPIEFRLLNHMASSPNQPMSRSQLLEAVWGTSVHVSERTVDVHVCGLRRKLMGHSHYIQSVPGMGYRFSLDTKPKKAA